MKSDDALSRAHTLVQFYLAISTDPWVYPPSHQCVARELADLDPLSQSYCNAREKLGHDAAPSELDDLQFHADLAVMQCSPDSSAEAQDVILGEWYVQRLCVPESPFVDTYHSNVAAQRETGAISELQQHCLQDSAGRFASAVAEACVSPEVRLAEILEAHERIWNSCASERLRSET